MSALNLTWNVLILFAFMLAYVQSLSVPLDVEEKCLAENNATRPELSAKIDQANAEGHLENVEMKYMCYVRCAAAEMNILDANGHIDIEQFQKLEHLRGQNIAVLNECSQVNNLEKDLCIYSFKMLLCLIQNFVTTEYLNITPGRQ
ncbi:general odorant-binding protein 57c [Drosophila virilis]|uniref:Odorant-binding protein 57c n=1 Tax=Drosophila virilis TaxID=7244 RepID=B4LKZ4_DROVI|nr:general odorant-binding protein 57c [Drosophila virilis]EDW60798.2 Odorant-binding protein 57c [Drosophila virilis]